MSDLNEQSPRAPKDLADIVVPAISYGLQPRPKRSFEGWHRPRKQFVRQTQWVAEIDGLVNDLDSDEISYLGLPGSDMLDIRLFHKAICLARGVRLKFLGFNTSAKSSANGVDLNTSLAEVHDLANIHESSIVLPDDFREIANEQSQAWSQTKLMGPYDIVNLDLCDGFAKEPVGISTQNHYNAMQQLMALQARRTNPWLLFLTTRIDRDNIEDEAMTQFMEVLESNLQDCEPFVEAIAATWGVSDSDGLDTYVSTDEGLASALITGMSKWLAALASDHSSATQLIRVDGYRVQKSDGHMDLVSLAIRFTPQPARRTDRYAIASLPGVAPSGPTECDQSVAIVQIVNSTLDVDSHLALNPEIRTTMIHATRTLIEEARGSAADYEQWLIDEEGAA